MIDTADIHARLYTEYQKTMFKESWHDFPHFLMVKIMRLENSIEYYEMCKCEGNHICERCWERYEEGDA